MPAFYFLHIASGRSWPTDDPHRWLLDRRDDPLLAPARDRLSASIGDQHRCLRVALCRCGLALVEATEGGIVVRHWGQTAPDLKGWARAHGWNRPGVRVAFENVKSGAVTLHADGQDALMYGARVGPTYPWPVYAARYDRRNAAGCGDQDAAPASATNFGWPGVPESRLAWRTLEAIWKADRVLCPNCDTTAFLTAFFWRVGPLSFRSARVVRHCPGCRRGFESDEPEPLAWLASVLPTDLRPTHVRQWRDFGIDWDRLVVRHLGSCGAWAAGDVVTDLVCNARR